MKKRNILVMTLLVIVIILSYVVYNDNYAIYNTVSSNTNLIAERIVKFDDEIEEKQKKFSENKETIKGSIWEIWNDILSNNMLCKYSIFYAKYELHSLGSYLMYATTETEKKALQTYIVKIHQIRKVIDKHNSWKNLSDVSSSIEEIDKIVGKDK